MSATPSSDYVLGSAEVEHDRLIRQGRRLAKFTEHLFREAGVGPGQRVLDIGSGVGEVTLLVARLVEGSGSVVGVDRDVAGLAKARARVAEAGLDNVRFIESDIAAVDDGRPFDAIVGRFVLMFQPDPVAVLRALSGCVRPGGVIVLQEASWPAFLSQVSRLPLWTACGTLVCEALRRGQVHTDMGPVLFRAFQDIGYPVPSMRIDIPIDQEPDTRRWLYDLLLTLRPRMEQVNLSLDTVGEIDTLRERLERELDDHRSYAAGVGLVGAWSRKP
jgi:ubiquinone/menaquinone biosynthesis C-methylase UbiE